MNLEHRLFPTDRRVRAIFGGETLADSPAAWMGVGGYRPPIYELGTWWFDRGDVRMDLLALSDHRTVCEVRGAATYWHVVTGARRGENLAYAYVEAPDGWEDLRNLITFRWNDIDPGRIDHGPRCATCLRSLRRVPVSNNRRHERPSTRTATTP